MHHVTPLDTTHRVKTYDNFVNLSGEENQLFYFLERISWPFVVSEVKASKGMIPSSPISPNLRFTT